MKKHASQSLEDLLSSYRNSPEPSFKVSNYFPIYVDLFDHLRGTECTFIETGILDGGSLFMWRNWLGHKARIIGIDLNPAATKWRNHGFEIFIGDQGDPVFWQNTLRDIGQFDALLDDGGHQSFQQIVTAYEGIRAAKNKCVIAVEDTCTNFMKEFSMHGDHTFLEFSKDSTDVLLAKQSDFFPNQFPPIANAQCVDHFQHVYSIQFFSGIVAFAIDPDSAARPELVRNRPANSATDFRYEGTNSATVVWPNPFVQETVTVYGGKRENKFLQRFREQFQKRGFPFRMWK